MRSRFPLALWLVAAGATAGDMDGSRLFPSCPMISCGGAPAGRELFKDPTFEWGFIVSSRHPWDQPNELGALVPDGFTGGSPAWRLAQWHSLTLLEPGTIPRLGDGRTMEAATATKRVQLRRDADGVVLSLACSGIGEYEGRLRQTGEPWPHLLIEQQLDAPSSAELSRLMFRIRFRVTGVRPDPTLEAGLDPSLHTAQTTAYWTVSVASADGHRDMFWFGIPLFDARHIVPPAHCAVDTGFPGATEKYIYTVAGDRFWSGSTGDGAWREMETDLIPLLREALDAIQSRGSLRDARPETLRLTSFNLGWEMPGPYDAFLEVSRLSLRAVPASPPANREEQQRDSAR